jgi:hypothetical protein
VPSQVEASTEQHEGTAGAMPAQIMYNASKEQEIKYSHPSTSKKA